ncbi:DUF3017 domain-containing protein [Luteococcus sp. OSA5]|uniref:DUF3017 domain-containing protein n=1 Tax=Luteococcus sp. OSA5 TaxID=3401630 RepID=UPI003B42A672
MSGAHDERRLARSRARAAAGSLNQWPLALVMVALLTSLGVTATGHWRRGAFAIGCSVLLAGALRAVLPARVAGLLAVRQRWFDATLLLLVGGAMLVLTLLVPHSKPGI